MFSQHFLWPSVSFPVKVMLSLAWPPLTMISHLGSDLTETTASRVAAEVRPAEDEERGVTHTSARKSA